jgi:hypothetical protein
MLTLEAADPRAAALVAAIHDGAVDELRRLLRDDPALATARLIDEAGVGRTLLHIVADWPGHRPHAAAAVAILVAAGADVNARVSHPDAAGARETPLHWAASADDVSVVDALLDAGADIEATGAVLTGGTPMADAIVFAQWHAARRLLERGATTTLWQAAALGLVDRVRALCTATPPPSARDLDNALWHACRGGQRLAATYLVGLGANPGWVGHDGRTPCDVAAESGNDALTQWLRRRRAR